MKSLTMPAGQQIQSKYKINKNSKVAKTTIKKHIQRIHFNRINRNHEQGLVAILLNTIYTGTKIA